MEEKQQSVQLSRKTVVDKIFHLSNHLYMFWRDLGPSSISVHPCLGLILMRGGSSAQQLNAAESSLSFQRLGNSKHLV